MPRAGHARDPRRMVRRRPGAPGRALAMAALAAAAAGGGAGAGGGGGLRVDLLLSGPSCATPARAGDAMSVHSRGSLESGAEPFEDTSVVGRPLTFTLGQGPVQAVDAGVLGRCPGDRVRVHSPPEMGFGAGGRPPAVPPDAALVYDLEVLRVNGRGPEDTQGAAGAGASVNPEQRCVACMHLVEGFWLEFVQFTMKKREEARAEPDGSKPPHLVYDADLEGLVQGFCRSKRIRGGQFAAFVQPECERIMKEHKREIVGHFLGQDLSVKSLVDKKEDICAKRTRSCRPWAPPPGPRGASGACGHCRTLFEHLSFEYSRQGPIPALQSPRTRARVALETICERGAGMHGYSTSYSEYCEDTLDESSVVLTEVLVESGGNIPAASTDFCVYQAAHCSEADAAPEWLERGIGSGGWPAGGEEL